MKHEYCKITLAPLSGDERVPGYTTKALRGLFGTAQVSPSLSFTHSEFARQGAQATQGLSISGVQEKLSLAVDGAQLVTVSRGGRYILKPSPVGYEHAAENEHAGMLVSKAVGIETAGCGLVSFSDSELAYITRRFDRAEGGVRLPQEDAASVLGLAATDKYETSYEAMGLAILEASGGKKAVVLDYFTRVMLAYVMGNDDLHAKNISLQRRANSRSQYFDALTPNYDVLFVSSLEGVDSGEFLALDLLKEEDTPEFDYYGFYTGHDFLALGNKLTLPRRAVQRAFAQITKAIPAIDLIIERSFMPSRMKQHALKTVHDRIGVIGIGLDGKRNEGLRGI